MRNQTRLRAASLILAIVVGSCSDEPTSPKSPPPPGIVLVTVRASGDDIDEDYEIVLGGVGHHIGLSAATSFAAHEGTQTVELQGVAANCTVTSQNPVSVAVGSGESVEIQFQVECATTGIRVTTRTSGYSVRGPYSLALGDQATRYLGSYDSTLFRRLQPGTYTVALELPGSAGSLCTVTGTPQRSVEVTNRNITRVVYEVDCVPPVRMEKIAYAFVTGNVGDTTIALVNPDGSGTVPLKTGLATGNSPAWSRDGTKLAYSGWICYLGCWPGMAVVDPETGQLDELNSGGGGKSPTWAPTGDMLAYIDCCSFAGSSKDRLAIIGVRPTDLHVREVPLPSLQAIGEPSWSREGRRIAFTCAVTLGNNDICIVNTDGSGFIQLTNEAGEDRKPAWSPDGSRIAFTTARFGAFSVAVMNADGSGVMQITSGSQPSWSPDGTRLVFTGADGLFTVRLDGSDLKRLTTGNHFAPAWRP